jgi:hypothetical protein
VCVWAIGFHHVTARSRLARVLKLMNRFFPSIFKFCFGPRKTVVTESADTGKWLYLVIIVENYFHF